MACVHTHIIYEREVCHVAEIEVHFPMAPVVSADTHIKFRIYNAEKQKDQAPYINIPIQFPLINMVAFYSKN